MGRIILSDTEHYSAENRSIDFCNTLDGSHLMISEK